MNTIHWFLVLFVVVAILLPGVLSVGAPSEQEGYFPPPESKGGWRKLEKPDEIKSIAGMDPDKLSELKDWLMASDKRDFAAVVIRNGYIVLEVERGNSSKTDSRRVASVSKAICATVLAIASERSQHGETPHKMTFDDLAFKFIPWAKPLSDPRKAKITVRQLLNHTSGICPEATGAPNDGTWQYILGLSGDERTAKLAFDPGRGCGYSTIALAHAALVCEYVTGEPYDKFAVEALFKPIGCEHWWFQYYDGGKEIGKHPSHGMGMPARDLARIAYCMLRDGKWRDKQVIPKWFVEQTAVPSHNVTTPEMRWGYNPKIFSLGWELPAYLTGQNTEGASGKGIPRDARYKPGSGGQLIAFVPSFDLVVTRQTGSSGGWQFAEYLRRACAAVLTTSQSSSTSYPPSTAIKSITWDRDTLESASPGSDLWPVTWGPDGNIYTSWGDGGGFGGTNSDGRVSMGFARIEGPPENYTGININGGKNCTNPASFPSKGKTSGIVFVDGVLYAWLNRQDGPWPDVNESLIWSNDRGATWKQSSWKWPSGPGNFKATTFLQFGKDYAGARDDYVYFYGRDEIPSAKGTRGFMGRVHRTKLKSRDAYEFFAGFDVDRGPIWSRDVNKRKPHFTDAAGVEGIQVVYDVPIKRYLLTVHRGDQGTLGVFDAPEPWGPWTTVAYYDNWLKLKGTGLKRDMLDINIPTKWISADGSTLWAVFSGGQDRFNMIRATLSLE